MLKLLVLGQLDIEGPDEVRKAILSQPKRAALLVCLSLNTNRVVTRNHLISLLWPDAADGRGRQALRQALHFLRNTLGRLAIGNHGDDALELDSGQVSCDATEFTLAAENADWIGAASMYTGPLLGQAWFDVTPEFDRWLDFQRASLEQIAVRTFRELSRSAHASGNAVQLEWCMRQALQSGLVDEEVAATCLGGLLSLHKTVLARSLRSQYASTLDRDFQLPPPHEVEKLFADLADETSSQAPTIPPAPLRVSAAVAVESKTGQRKHKKIFLRVGLFAAVAVLVLTIFTQTPRPSDSPRRVLVLPFENRTDDTLADPIGYIVADWISISLDRLGSVQSVSPNARFAEPVDLVTTAAESVLPLGIERKADGTHADIVVWGVYYKSDGQFRFVAQLYDRVTEKPVMTLPPVHAIADSPITGISALQKQVTTALGVSRDPEISLHVPSEAVPSYDAYRDYVHARRIVHAGIDGNVEQSLRRALSASPEFRAAQLMLGEVFALGRRYGELDSLLQQLPFPAALSGWDFDVWLWLEASSRGDHPGAAAALAKLSASYPGYPFFPQQYLRVLLWGGMFDDVVSAVSVFRRDGSRTYASYLQDALHHLGRYDDELIDAAEQDAMRGVPDAVASPPIRAFIGAGRIGEAERMMEQLSRSATGTGGSRNSVALLTAGNEMRIHGYPEQARYWRARALEAIQRDGTIPDEIKETFILVDGELAPLGDEWRIHLQTFDGTESQLSARLPGIRNTIGYLAAYAATHGQPGHAEFLLATFQNWLPNRFDRGITAFTRAQVRAKTGDYDEAGKLVVRAVAEGLPVRREFHHDWLLLLRGQPDFDSLTKSMNLDPKIWRAPNGSIHEPA